MFFKEFSRLSVTSDGHASDELAMFMGYFYVIIE